MKTTFVILMVVNFWVTTGNAAGPFHGVDGWEVYVCVGKSLNCC